MPIKYHQWQGRIDHEDGAAGRRIHQAVQPITKVDNQTNYHATCLIGLTSDLGVQRNQGRIGARKGPQALRNALANLAWHEKSELFDAGDITIAENGDDPLATAQTEYAAQVAQTLQQTSVLGLGGGHEIGWASYQGYRQYLEHIGQPQAKLGILNFDAHFDLRKPPANANWAGTSGTPFYQAAQDCQHNGLDFNYACLGVSESSNTQALFQTADTLNTNYLLDIECTNKRSRKLIDHFIKDLDYLYVTICLDALPAAIAPGVSAPAALGISPVFIIKTLGYLRQTCADSGVKWLLSDIAELNPEYDIDNRTAKVAARLAYEVIKLNQQS